MPLRSDRFLFSFPEAYDAAVDKLDDQSELHGVTGGGKVVELSNIVGS